MVDQLLPEWLSREAIAAAIALSALVETPVVVTIGHYNISFSHLEDFYQYELNDEPPHRTCPQKPTTQWLVCRPAQLIWKYRQISLPPYRSRSQILPLKPKYQRETRSGGNPRP